jgi:hypothetical protein
VVAPGAPVTLVVPIGHPGGRLTLAATLRGPAQATVWASDAALTPRGAPIP